MTNYYLIAKGNKKLAVVYDDSALLAVENIEDRVVFYKETTAVNIYEINFENWKNWKTLPEDKFLDMINAMDPESWDVLRREKVYDAEEVPSEWGEEDGRLVLVPVADFPKQLKSARKRLHLTQAKVVEIFRELPVRTWQDWEAGRRNPPAYVQDLILEKLNNLQ